MVILGASPVFYKVGTKTLRPDGCGPLAAFASQQEAEDFASRHAHWATLIACAILEGEGEFAGEKGVDKPWKGLWWKGAFTMDLDCIPHNTLFLESFTPEKTYPLGK